MTLRQPVMGAYEDRAGSAIKGPTATNALIDLSPQGEFAWDENYSPAGSYVSGTAAAALLLTQVTGASVPSPGEVSELVHDMIQNFS